MNLNVSVFCSFQLLFSAGAGNVKQKLKENGEHVFIILISSQQADSHIRITPTCTYPFQFTSYALSHDLPTGTGENLQTPLTSIKITNLPICILYLLYSSNVFTRFYTRNDTRNALGILGNLYELLPKKSEASISICDCINPNSICDFRTPIVSAISRFFPGAFQEHSRSTSRSTSRVSIPRAFPGAFYFFQEQVYTLECPSQSVLIQTPKNIDP